MLCLSDKTKNPSEINPKGFVMMTTFTKASAADVGDTGFEPSLVKPQSEDGMSGGNEAVFIYSSSFNLLIAFWLDGSRLSDFLKLEIAKALLPTYK